MSNAPCGKIRTECAMPPLEMLKPLKWYAWRDDEPDYVGNGTSKHQAIANLRKQLAEREGTE